MTLLMSIAPVLLYSWLETAAVLLCGERIADESIAQRKARESTAKYAMVVDGAKGASQVAEDAQASQSLLIPAEKLSAPEAVQFVVHEAPPLEERSSDENAVEDEQWARIPVQHLKMLTKKIRLV